MDGRIYEYYADSKTIIKEIEQGIAFRRLLGARGADTHSYYMQELVKFRPSHVHSMWQLEVVREKQAVPHDAGLGRTSPLAAVSVSAFSSTAAKSSIVFGALFSGKWAIPGSNSLSLAHLSVNGKEPKTTAEVVQCLDIMGNLLASLGGFEYTDCFEPLKRIITQGPLAVYAHEPQFVISVVRAVLRDAGLRLNRPHLGDNGLFVPIDGPVSIFGPNDELISLGVVDLIGISINGVPTDGEALRRYEAAKHFDRSPDANGCDPAASDEDEEPALKKGRKTKQVSPPTKEEKRQEREEKKSPCLNHALSVNGFKQYQCRAANCDFQHNSKFDKSVVEALAHVRTRNVAAMAAKVELYKKKKWTALTEEQGQPLPPVSTDH